MEIERQGGVLVTGGRGFVGRSLGNLLRRDGYRVISADLTPVEAGSNETVCDITSVSELRRVFQRERIDAIVHLAAILPTAAQRQPLLATRVNIEGSVNLLELAREFEVQRFIFGSSLSVYGTCPMDQVVSESDRTAPEDLYGSAKVYVERLGEAYRQSWSTEFASLRIGRVVGPGTRSTTSAWRSEIFEQLTAAGPVDLEIPYAESERILLVHVDDVASMLSHLVRAKRLRHSLYNAACESVTVGALKRELEQLNPRVRVILGGKDAVGNPRRIDWSRLQKEFGFDVTPIFDRLAVNARERAKET